MLPVDQALAGQLCSLNNEDPGPGCQLVAERLIVAQKWGCPTGLPSHSGNSARLAHPCGSPGLAQTANHGGGKRWLSNTRVSGQGRASLPLAEERRGPRWACQQPCHLPSRWGVVTRGLSPLPGSVRKMGFQRALLPRAKSIAGTQAAVQTPFKWKLPINQGLYPDANKAVSAHLGKQQAGGDRSRRPGISTWVWASRTHTC